MKHTILLFLFAFTQVAFAQDSQQRSKHFNIDDNLAIDGYDPVSFFNNSVEEGKKQYKAEVNGVLYRFVSEENRKKFVNSPSKYEPAFGGWCAYAMGNKGEKVKVDPETFKIVDGKLYLFYNFWGNNTLEDWNKDESNLDRKAIANWKKWLTK